MGSLLKGEKIELPHWFRWGGLHSAYLTLVVCTLASIEFMMRGNLFLSPSIDPGFYFLTVIVGLLAASVVVISIASRFNQTVFMIARIIVALSAIAVVIAPEVGVLQQANTDAGSSPTSMWILTAGLVVISVAFFTLDKKGRPISPITTTWLCLAGFIVLAATFVDKLFSLLPGDSYYSGIQLPATSALALLCILVSILVYVSAGSIDVNKQTLQRILKMRSVAVAIAVLAPVTVQVIRILIANTTGITSQSAELYLTVFMMASLSSLVWFGFNMFMKREAQMLDARSRIETSRSRYTRALKSSNLGVWEWNIETNVLHWSEKVVSLFGFETGEMETTYENFLCAVHLEDRQSVINAVNASIYEGAEYDIEHRVVHPDGSVRWLHERGDVERNPDGEAVRMIGVVGDVTDNKFALMRLAESEAKYEAVVLNVPGVVYRIVVTDGRPEFEYISPSIYGLLEIDIDTACDFPLLLSMMHPEDQPRMNESILNRDDARCDYWRGRLVVGDKVKWIESRSAHTIDQEGQIRVDGVLHDITERVESESKLSASEARFERLVDNAPGMVFQVVHSNDDVISIPYVSPGVEEIFGLTQEEVVESPDLLDSCVHEDDHESHTKLIHEALHKMEDFVWTGRIRRTDGEVRSIQVSSRPSSLDDGTIIWDGMIIDVTEEKRAAEELRVTRDRLAGLLSSSPTMIYACDGKSPYALNFISDNVSDHLGYSQDECLQSVNFFADRTHPDDTDSVNAVLTSIEQNRHSLFEYRLKNSSGEYRWIRDEMRFIDKPDGREIVGTMTDVTERKLAEEALRLSNERFRAMSGASPLSIFMADEYGKIVYVNSKMTEVLMLGEEKLYGDGWHNFVYKADLDRMTSILQRSTMERTPFALDCRLIRADKNVIWCSVKAAPMFDHGALVGFVGTIEDITDRHDLEVATERARIEAEQANQAKSEFLSRMSHELRTPLNAILGYAQLLEMDADKIDTKPLTQILSGGRHLLSLINEVLDIAKIESGDLGIEHEPIKLKPIVDEVIQLLQPIAHERAVALDFRVDQDDMTFVIADPHRLKQVVLNVVSNAIKYNKPEGFVSVMFEHDSDSFVELIVRDTGKGIASDKLHRLFTPFDRLGAEASAIEGSGLGLALTQRLLSAMNGRIEIESEEGVGTLVRIDLKRAENPEYSLPLLLDQSRAAIESVGKAGRILLIEDNEANIKLMQAIFMRRSHLTLDVAMTGSLGIDLAQKHRPDLILLDVNLPDSIGTNVIERIKSDPILKDTDVIVVSADANKKQVERFMKAGARGYLTKPVNITELLRLVDGVLDTV